MRAKTLLYAVLPFILMCSCRGPVLVQGNWNDEVYGAICRVLKEGSGGYAVFDCDNTSIKHDVSICLMLYQIENLRFADAPAHCFLDGIEDVDRPLQHIGGLTAAQMGLVLRDEYNLLKASLDAGATLEALKQEDLYKDYKARFLAFYDAVAEEYDYSTFCLWLPALLCGMTQEEARSLGRESTLDALSQGRVWVEKWISPDGQFSAVAEKGIVVTREMKDLYSALRRSGIDVYICSASAEWLVEQLACDPEIGFGLDEDHVYGIRLSSGQTVQTSYQEGYVQPFMEGKVSCIKSFMAPSHGGAAPLLVAGDSRGDVNMLTYWDDTRLSLIMDWGRSGKIRELADRNDGRFYAQKVSLD